MQNSLSRFTITFLTFFSLVLLLGAGQGMASQKVKGEVVDAGKDAKACESMVAILPAEDVCQGKVFKGLSSVIIATGKASHLALKKDQSVILKASGAGKTTGKVLAVVDGDKLNEETMNDLSDKKELVVWKIEEGKKLVIVEPKGEFQPEKGAKIKMILKRKVQRVEGC